MLRKYFDKYTGKNLNRTYSILMTIVVLVMSYMLWNRPPSDCTCNVPERSPREVVINDMSSSSDPTDE